MNKDQAVAFQGYVLKAAAAIEEASIIASKSGLEEREILFKIANDLHFEVLPAIYHRYPELKPPEPPPGHQQPTALGPGCATFLCFRS